MNNNEEVKEYDNEETEILEPIIDTSDIVPVAPPVAIAPPPVEKVEETEVLAEEVPVVEEKVETLESENNVAVGVAPVQESVDTAASLVIPEGQPIVEDGVINLDVAMKEIKIGNETQNQGNFKYVMTFVLFIILGGTIIFMPEISNYIAQVKYEKEYSVAPKIMSGVLKCELSRNSDKFDMNYVYKFNFDDNKFKKLSYTSETRGDANLDEAELEKLNNECLLLKEITESIDGIVVSCDYRTGSVTKSQALDYSKINVDDAYTAYSEAGGVYPDYNYLEDMDNIEKNMKAAGYTCERFK